MTRHLERVRIAANALFWAFGLALSVYLAAAAFGYEGVNLFSMPLPRPFYGKTLAETEIGARTGLTVIALQRDEETTTHLTASTVLTPDTHLLMLGDTQQRRDFITLFGNGL
jgi:uncharacterized protein with PhoU and TrkA domain